MPKAVPHTFINGVESKQCCWCHETLPITKFWGNAKRRDGLQTHCAPCSLEWKRKNKDLVNKLNRLSKSRNKEKNSAYNMAYAKKRYHTDISYRLRTVMSAAVSYSLRGRKNGESWRKLVGYTVDDLRKSLSKKMLPGMTWDNYGEWQIDHIIPVTAFNIESKDCIDFKKCWALSNLRPLWRLDNILKNNKLSQPFQPSLSMAV